MVAARGAQSAWAQTSVAQRLDLFQAIHSRYEARREELGAPIDLARGAQTGAGMSHLEGFSTALPRVIFDEVLANGNRLIREPISIAGLITPWNWPLHQIGLKVVGALASGCAVVLKPSESTPICAMIFADIPHEADCPPGLLNLVNGDGLGAGRALSLHPDVEVISFTGSTRAGIFVARDAALSVKRVALELGGKSASLIFADADIEAAISVTFSKLFLNSGQYRNAPTRLFVERPVYERAKKLALQSAAKWRVSMPGLPGDHIGPVANDRQYTHVCEMILKGIEEGVTLLAGGPQRPKGLNTGFCVRPTVLADATNGMVVPRTEIFGPVLVMIPFDTEEEALRLANDTPYGLSACAHSTDTERCDRLARGLRAGMVFFNGADIASGSPFGGVKQSGNSREGGIVGIE